MAQTMADLIVLLHRSILGMKHGDWIQFHIKTSYLSEIYKVYREHSETLNSELMKCWLWGVESVLLWSWLRECSTGALVQPPPHPGHCSSLPQHWHAPVPTPRARSRDSVSTNQQPEQTQLTNGRTVWSCPRVPLPPPPSHCNMPIITNHCYVSVRQLDQTIPPAQTAGEKYLTWIKDKIFVASVVKTEWPAAAPVTSRDHRGLDNTRVM